MRSVGHPRILVALTIGGALIMITLFIGVGYIKAARLDALTFSNTQSWNMEMHHERDGYISFMGNSAEALTLPPPPRNSSKIVANELTELHEYAKHERTKENVARIESEVSLDNAYFGELTYREILSGRHETGLLFERMLPEFTALIIRQKEYFNRVRPSYLDPTLSTLIPVPEHPAYPSGHAGQSMLIALVLGELDPENAPAYLESAKRIAHGREIAGVHYPSDSAAGQLLAEQYFTLLMDNKRFKDILESARTEW